MSFNTLANTSSGNTSFATAIAIALNTPVSVSVNAANEKRYYSFTPATTGSYTFESSANTGDPYGWLYNSGQAQIASDDDSAGNRNFLITYSLTAGQKYFIAGGCYSTGIGSYTLKVTSAAAAIPTIALNTYRDVSLPAGQHAVYEFRPATAGNYNIYTGPYGGTGASNDTYLELYSDAALTNRIAYNDDYGGMLFSQIIHNMNANTSYYIKLRHYSASTGVHARITVIADMPTISLNAAVDVNLPVGQYVAYRFRPTKTASYDIVSSPYGGGTTSCDTYLELYSDQNLTNRMAYNDDYGGTLFSKITHTLTANVEYYIKFRTYSTSQALYARIRVSETVVDPFTTATQITINGTASGTMAAGGKYYYKITPLYSGPYKIYTTSSIDTYGHLYDSGKTQIASDDDSRGARDFQITYPLTAGQTYYVMVRGYSTSIAGSYTLKVEDPFATQSVIVVDDANGVSGNLKARDFDSYKFTVAQNGSHTITYSGATSTRYIYSSSKNLMLADSAPTSTYNFTITGTYYIAVLESYTTTNVISTGLSGSSGETPASDDVYGDDIPKEDNLDYVDPDVDSSAAGAYIVKIASPAPPAPKITAHPVSQTKFVGESVTFSVTASGGTPPLKYQWWVCKPSEKWQIYGTGVAGSAGTASSLTLDGVSTAANGNQYRCYVSNSDGTGSIPSNPATLTVKTPQWTISTASIAFPPARIGYGAQTPQEVRITNNETVALSYFGASMASGDEYFEITSQPSTTIGGGSASSLYVRPKTVLQTGTYTGTLRVSLRISSTTINKDVSLSFTVNVPTYTYKFTVNNYFDEGYCVRYGETALQSRVAIADYMQQVANRYETLFGLKVTSDDFPCYFESAIDKCKKAVSPTNKVDLTNINTLYSGHTIPGSTSKSYCTHKDGPNGIKEAFTGQYTSSNKITNAYWSGHKIETPFPGSSNAKENNSFRSGAYIYMITLYDKANRKQNSQGTLMHELNHTLDGQDHYHNPTTPGLDSSCLTRCRKKSPASTSGGMNCDSKSDYEKYFRNRKICVDNHWFL